MDDETDYAEEAEDKVKIEPPDTGIDEKVDQLQDKEVPASVREPFMKAFIGAKISLTCFWLSGLAILINAYVLSGALLLGSIGSGLYSYREYREFTSS